MASDLPDFGHHDPMARVATLLPPFRCGHPRTDENLQPHINGFICRTCHRKHARNWKVKNYRKRALPLQLENTRRKLKNLEREAAELGLDHLLHPGRQA